MPIALIILGFGLVAVGVFFAVTGFGIADASGSAVKGIQVQGPAWLILVALGVGTILFGAWQFEEKGTQVKDVPVTVPPVTDLEDDFAGDEPFDYGDDEALDRLWNQCESGDLLACDDLFFESAEGTEYEWFGATCGGITDGSGWCSPITEEQLEGD